MNSKSKNKRDMVFIIGGIALALLGHFFIMYLINNVGISPMWFTVIIAYVALVYPQKLALDSLKGYAYMEDEDLDLEDFETDKSNWVIFAQDYKLTSYFGSDTALQKIINILLVISIPLMIFSISYVNILVALWDLGATFAWIMIYTMFISTAVYVLTKSIIIGYFIYQFTNNIILSLTAIVYPLGAYIISLFVKKAQMEYDSLMYDEAMGADYNK